MWGEASESRKTDKNSGLIWKTKDYSISKPEGFTSLLLGDPEEKQIDLYNKNIRKFIEWLESGQFGE